MNAASTIDTAIGQPSRASTTSASANRFTPAMSTDAVANVSALCRARCRVAMAGAAGVAEAHDDPALGVTDRDALLEQDGGAAAVARRDPAEHARRHPAQRRGPLHDAAEGAAPVPEHDLFVADRDDVEVPVDRPLEPHVAVGDLLRRE